MPKKLSDYTGLKKKKKSDTDLSKMVTPVVGAVTVIELSKLLK